MQTPLPDSNSYEVFNALDQGFCTIEVLFDAVGTPTDYRFIAVNGAFEHHTGLGEATGCRIRELAPGHEQHWYDLYGEVATSGTPKRFEQEAAALGRWYEVYAFRVGDPGLHHVAVLFRDITDRKKAECALESARAAADQANRAKDGRERAAGGLGLGLAIVKTLVAAHGGKVRAESRGLNQGTEFIVELPAIDAPAS